MSKVKDVVILKCKEINGKEYIEYDAFIDLMKVYVEDLDNAEEKVECLKKTNEELLRKYAKLEAERNDLRVRIRAYGEENIPFYQPEE